MPRPWCLRCIQIKPGAHAKIPAVGFASDVGTTRAGVGCDQGKAQLGGQTLRTSLHHEGFFVASQSSQVHHGGHRALRCLRWQKHRKAHGQPDFARFMLVKALHAGKTGVLADQLERLRHQNSTTPRIDSPRFMRSNPLLMSSSGMVWVIRSSMLILPSMYQSTILGTSVRPRAPPKAEPSHLRPVTSWKGWVLISAPASATPMMMLRPQPLCVHSSAWRMTLVLPMHSKL